MASIIHDPTALPAFSEDLALRLLVRGSDVTIHVDENLVVTAVLTGVQTGDISLDHWVGAGLASLLTPDSQSKLDLLLADNAAIAGAEGRWRHLNFEIGETTTLPLLVKLFAYRNARKTRMLLFCRDLRAVADIHDRFQEETRRFEAEYGALRRKLALLRSHGDVASASDDRAKKH